MTDQSEWKPIVQKTVVEIEQAFEELQKTWESIGCTTETRVMYYEQAYNHIKDLLNDMVSESQTKEQLLLENIEKLLKQTTDLRMELHLDIEHKTYDQVPLNKVEQMLSTDLQTLESLKKERVMVLKELLNKEQEICKKLGARRLSITENVLPTEEELESFKLYLQKQEIEKKRLENIFTDMHCSIIKMMNSLNITPHSSFEHLVCDNPEDFMFSTNNMIKLREFRDQLMMQMEETKCQADKMKEDILALWKYLEEPVEFCQSFFDKYSDYSASTIKALNKEIERCKEKKKENIFKYVKQIRLELINLWDKCKYSEIERNSFAHFHSLTFTEDLLTLHELEVEKLQKFYNDNQMIFELLEQRETLLNKVKEILQRANNPDRYHNRGCQLLMEEKERKVINTKLPKVEEKLRQLIDEYKSAHNKMFTIYGISLENVLAESLENVNHEKETIKKKGKEAKDKSIKKSPLINSSKRTPGISHLSIYRGQTPSGLSKRKLFTPSPNTSAKRRNKNGDKNRPTITVSKVRRSNRLSRSAVQKGHRSSLGGKRNKESSSANNSITDTTYNQFQGHMTDREELHSSLLPDQILKNSNKLNVRTPIRTPVNSLRKNPSGATTPTCSSARLTPTCNSARKTPTCNSVRKTPRSPKIVRTPKLTTVPNNLPFIF